MKKYILTFFLLLIFIVNGCSVYEDIYFLENGRVKYNMTIDGGEMMALLGESSLKGKNTYPKDSIINFSQIVRDTLDVIPAEIEQDMKNIEPIYMRVQNNDSLGILKISVYGNFDNMEAFTKALASMSKIEKKVKNKKEESPVNNFPIDNLFNRNSYSWDGTTLKRTVTSNQKEVLDEEDMEDSMDKKIDESVNRLFSQGKMVVKYHFPKKIKEVSNKDATFSMDGKTVILNYPASLYLNPNEELSIEVITE